MIRWIACLIAVSLIGSTLSAGPDIFLAESEMTLLARYAVGVLAPVPLGFVPGTAIFDPGTPKASRKARWIGRVWKGKVFTADGRMINRLPVGLEAVTARVESGASWYDGQPTLIFDYQGESRVFGHVRDEVREIAPGLYLGLTYLRQKCGPPKLSNFFILDARCGCSHPGDAP